MYIYAYAYLEAYDTYIVNTLTCIGARRHTVKVAGSVYFGGSVLPGMCFIFGVFLSSNKKKYKGCGCFGVVAAFVLVCMYLCVCVCASMYVSKWVVFVFACICVCM